MPIGINYNAGVSAVEKCGLFAGLNSFEKKFMKRRLADHTEKMLSVNQVC